MLRSSRTIALIQALMLGTAAAMGTVALSTTLVGCSDDTKPDYWVEKLEDAKWQPRAIKRLEQFYEDAVTRANKDANAKEVRDLVNAIVGPLTKVYVEGYDKLDTKSRVSLIQLLSGIKDPRTEAAIKKAFEEFAKRPRTAADDADIKWAARAMKELKLVGAAGAMLDAFQKLKSHTMLGGVAYRDMNEAMLAMPQQSWAGSLQKMLEADITAPTKEPSSVEEYKDQLFWQTAAAQILGELKSAESADALLKVVLDPAKGDVGATALMALVKIGKPAADKAVKLLNGELPELKAFHLAKLKAATGAKEAPSGAPEKQLAAIILGMMGRTDSVAPMIKALEEEKDDGVRALLARELSKLPPTADSKAAFKAAFEKIPLDTTMPQTQGENALQTLTSDYVTRFYDPAMVDWLLERSAKIKGGEEEKKAFDSAVATTVLKLAKHDQLAKLEDAIKKLGTQLERDMLVQASKQLKACTDRVACYLGEIEKSENQDDKNQFVAIKAGYMIGILGNDQARGDLIDRLSSIDNAGIRFVAAQTIDYLSPKGSAAAADKLEAIIDKNVKSADKDKIAGDAALKQVMYRIRARAQ
jgi:hypothetical protein